VLSPIGSVDTGYYLAGYFTGDGAWSDGTRGRSSLLRFCGNENDKGTVLSHLRKIGVEPIFYERPAKSGGLNWTCTLPVRYHFWLTRLGIISSNAHSVRVPRAILNSPDLSRTRSFLSGYWDADGCVYAGHPENRKDRKLSCFTASNGLVFDLILLLDRLSVLNLRLRSATKEMNGKIYEGWSIHVRGSDRQELLSQLFLQPKKAEAALTFFLPDRRGKWKRK